MKGVGNDASAPPTADALETVHKEAHAGSETAAERGISAPAGPGPEQSVPAGPLSRLLSKISADPTEILQALEDLGKIISERVLREIRGFRRDFETRLESMETRSDARHDVQDGKIDTLRSEMKGLRAELNGLRAELNGLRLELRLLMGLVALLIVVLGALAGMGIVDRFGTDRVVDSPPSLEVQAPQAEAEESVSELGSPPPDSAPAEEDADRPEEDPPEGSDPTLPSARLPTLGAKESAAPLQPSRPAGRRAYSRSCYRLGVSETA